MSRGIIDADKCVTHIYPLEEFEEAINRKPEGGEAQVKVAIDPHL
jgi:threonine dehydrogenase-like Zn-dependent dehydrogenase